MRELKVYIKLKSVDAKNPSLADFTEFLTALNECHNLVVLYSQKEYDHLDISDDLTTHIRDEHQLKITNVKRDNPFILELIFNIDPDQLIEFLKYLKLCFYGCGLYQSASNKLLDSLIKWLIKRGYAESEEQIIQDLLKDYERIYRALERIKKTLCKNKFKILNLTYILEELNEIIIDEE
ncbi:MAG: hypothetical protein ACK50Y_03040 [Flavobacteriia bacterium]|jgi:hypothetical protein